MKYRHELKYFTSTADLELIRARISSIARPDPHQTFPEGYLITSLYFDNIYDKCASDTINGSDLRSKYRIRIYDHNSNIIKLERKSKVNGMTAKHSVAISADECRDFMDCRIPSITDDQPEIKKQILCEMNMLGMRPVCIVQYLREAFIYPSGNVRITFDKNIDGSSDIGAFLDPHIDMIPALGTNCHILEVKYDNFLPSYIQNQMEIGYLQQTSFSKYIYARKAVY